MEVKEKKYLIDNKKLMSEWNYDKNKDLELSNITLGSHKKVWWKCSKGHEWEAIINSRSRGTNCPECYESRKRKDNSIHRY